MHSLPPEGSARRDWSLFLAFVIAYGGLAATWGELREKASIAVDRDVKQDNRIDKIADSVRTIETSRALEREIADLRAEVAALRAVIERMERQEPRRR